MSYDNYPPNALLAPLRVGGMEANNRIVMAPMTRARSTVDNVPTPLMAEYYAQRASAGLIVTEATLVAPLKAHWGSVPGIFTEDQATAWSTVTDAVHSAGGKMILQLWHPGRSKTPDYALEEIREIVKKFQDGARRARQAGFDGVELHGTNGYVIEQFLRDGSNQRTDEYGGSLENRIRFALEVLEAVFEEWPSDLVGIKVSPIAISNKIADSDAAGTVSHLARRLNGYGLAYLHAMASNHP